MKLRMSFYIIISFLLCSCVAAIVAGAAGGMVVYDRRSMSMLESDARIFYVAHKEIVTDPHFRQSRIVVTSFNQVVLLTGQTPNASVKSIAAKIVRKIPNVRRVYDEITIDHPISLTEQSKDTWITSQVRSKMLTKKGLESGSIRVVTENSVVYLMGIVTQEQANLAVSVARQINAVTKVVKIFQYIV